jgi:hypothetical protein
MGLPHSAADFPDSLIRNAVRSKNRPIQKPLPECLLTIELKHRGERTTRV